MGLGVNAVFLKKEGEPRGMEMDSISPICTQQSQRNKVRRRMGLKYGSAAT